MQKAKDPKYKSARFFEWFQKQDPSHFPKEGYQDRISPLETLLKPILNDLKAAAMKAEAEAKQAEDEAKVLVSEAKLAEAEVKLLKTDTADELKQAERDVKEANEALEKAIIEAKQLGLILLNDHGIDHIHKVIENAYKLIQNSNCEITPYEAYLLIIAAYFHDIGNIYGRALHVDNCWPVMHEASAILGGVGIENTQIIKIAQAHGGRVKETGSKDTISELPLKADTANQTVRLQMLAAILRFADELADDQFRASEFLMNEGLLGESSLYHAYSSSLDSVKLESESINLEYCLHRNNIIKPFSNSHGDTFLLDEIYSRLCKMHREREYCMRFLNPDFNVKTINATISLLDNFSKNQLVEPIHDPIRIRLESNGYPDETPDIASYCTSQQDFFTGKELADEIALD